MYYLYLSACAVLTFLFLSKIKNKALAILASVVVWLLGLFIVTRLQVHTLGAPDQSELWAQVILFIALLLGMNAKYLWDRIEERSSRNAKRNPDEPKIGVEFDFWDFVKPMLVSAIVFLAIASNRYELTTKSLLFSFQNGFFWQTIFRSENAKSRSKRISKHATSGKGI